MTRSVGGARLGLGLALALGLALGSGLARAAVVEVGAFTRPATAGAGVQTVRHGLGEVPKAVILWTGGKTSEAPARDGSMAIGFSDGTTHRSVGFGVASYTNNASHRRMAASAIHVLRGDGIVAAEATMAVTATELVVTWSGPPGGAANAVIHYVAIGGRAVLARVRDWSVGTASGVDRRVTGVGFRPDACLTLWSGLNYLADTPLGTTQPRAKIGLGAADRAGRQWALLQLSDDEPTSIAYRSQVTDATYLMALYENEVRRARWRSMDPDGFTVVASGTSAQDTRLVSLCLQGLEVLAGSFEKSTDRAPPVLQPVVGPSFVPGLVLLASGQAHANAGMVPHARFGLGASDGIRAGFVGTTNENDSPAAAGWGFDRVTKVFLKTDNDSGGIEAEAELVAFRPSGFDLRWTANDTIPTQIVYLALGARDAAAPDAGPPDLPPPPPDAEAFADGADAGAAAPDGPADDGSAQGEPDAAAAGTRALQLEIGCGCRTGAGAGERPGPLVIAVALALAVALAVRRLRPAHFLWSCQARRRCSCKRRRSRARSCSRGRVARRSRCRRAASSNRPRSRSDIRSPWRRRASSASRR